MNGRIELASSGPYHYKPAMVRSYGNTVGYDSDLALTCSFNKHTGIKPTRDRKRAQIMIGYITLGTNNLERAAKFYDALLAELGAKRTMTDKRMLGWGRRSVETMFSVIAPFDENEATPGNGAMTALLVGSGEAVEKIYQKALELGATDEGAPHDRNSSMGFYGGYFRDLDGNKLVVYCLGWKGK